MINPKCSFCIEELKEYGGILLSPPDKNNRVEKLHMCISCYLDAKRFSIVIVKQKALLAEKEARIAELEGEVEGLNIYIKSHNAIISHVIKKTKKNLETASKKRKYTLNGQCFDCGIQIKKGNDFCRQCTDGSNVK